MRIWTGMIGVAFIWASFYMTSWHFKGEARKREPNFTVRAISFGVGVFSIALAFWWPY
jgi:hypothetical protein